MRIYPHPAVLSLIMGDNEVDTINVWEAATSGITYEVCCMHQAVAYDVASIQIIF